MPNEQYDNLPRWDGPLSHPFYSKVVKRVLDFLLALILLIPGLIIMIPLAVWVKLDSPGPVIYRALRGGYHNKPFYIMKFRSMVVDADKSGGCTALNDSRVTRAGKIMRRLKLDELPQLFNILKGEMSFVGPRPELLLYTTQYTREQECILWVRPGITDRSSIVYIAQDEIVGTENPVENFEKYILPEKNRLRVEYAKNQSFLLDAELFAEGGAPAEAQLPEPPKAAPAPAPKPEKPRKSKEKPPETEHRRKKRLARRIVWGTVGVLLLAAVITLGTIGYFTGLIERLTTDIVTVETLPQSTTASFENDIFERAARDYTGIADGDITVSDLAGLHELYIIGDEYYFEDPTMSLLLRSNLPEQGTIRSLDDLKYFTGLDTLWICDQQL